MKPKLIALCTAGILVFIVLLQNTQVVTLRFLFWEMSMSRIILMLLILVVGFITGFIVGQTTRQGERGEL